MNEWLSRTVACLMLFAFFAGPANVSHAQSDGLDTVLNAAAAKRDLREQQNELFQQLLNEPDNIDLMFTYARVSIALEDYEAAISTLERLLIYRQDIPQVRIELAVAYFQLGSYEVAKVYFEQALAEPDIPDNAVARIQPYMDEIEARTRTSAFSVIANAGITYATNATLGPDSEQIRVNGFDATLLDGQKEGDFGSRALVNVSHVYDLQRANDDSWRTDVSAFSVRYFNEDAGDVLFTQLRTGPRLSLTDEQFGPKIRPYVEGQYLNVSDRGLFASFGVGAEYVDTLSPIFSVFGDAGVRYRNYFRKEFTDEDTYNAYLSAGLAYIPVRDLILRGGILAELDFADEIQDNIPFFAGSTGQSFDGNSNVEVGLRGSAEFQYDSGLDWVDRKWSLSGFAEVRGRWFNEPDPIIDRDKTRRDLDLRGGISHVFSLQEGFGVQVDVDALLRESNIVNFDLDNVSTTVSLQYRM
ncbi:MAG: tetratricopeptide repeat protein [Paracoccaceae bacterium]